MLNSKKKGNKGENDFAHWLQENGIRAWRNSSSGSGLYKGDINNSLDYTFEVKTVKKINLMEAWRQAQKDSSIAHNKPLLAIHFDGMGKREWLIIQHSEDWLESIKTLIPFKGKID